MININRIRITAIVDYELYDMLKTDFNITLVSFPKHTIKHKDCMLALVEGLCCVDQFGSNLVSWGPKMGVPGAQDRAVQLIRL